MVTGFTLSTLSGRKSLLAPDPIEEIPSTDLFALVYRVYERRGKDKSKPDIYPKINFPTVIRFHS
jgi:hypothetical protein